MMATPLPNGWALRSDRPVLTSPTGREFRLARTRSQAIDVVRAVVLAMDAQAPDHRLRTISLRSVFEHVVSIVRTEPEDTLGPAMTQFLDVVGWDLEWSDVDAEAYVV